MRFCHCSHYKLDDMADGRRCTRFHGVLSLLYDHMFHLVLSRPIRFYYSRNIERLRRGLHMMNILCPNMKHFEYSYPLILHTLDNHYKENNCHLHQGIVRLDIPFGRICIQRLALSNIRGSMVGQNSVFHHLLDDGVEDLDDSN